MFHWEYPLALQARGAWENPTAVVVFHFAALSPRYGDR
jgi:beta-glucosidase/6-phospho-beta-glucosidase/beta-galactosidase